MSTTGEQPEPSDPSNRSLVDVVHQRVLGEASIARALVPNALDALVREVAPLLPPSEVAAVAERVRARAIDASPSTRWCTTSTSDRFDGSDGSGCSPVVLTPQT